MNDAPQERCPVCLADAWELDYAYADAGETPVYRCSTCGWPPPSPHTVEEYRTRWLDVGATAWSHPGPEHLRHIGVLIDMLQRVQARRD